MKNIQIPMNLFMALIRYHIFDRADNQKEIKEFLEQKLDKMVSRELYTKYKTAPTEEEKENARLKYLDKKGIHRDFRW